MVYIGIFLKKKIGTLFLDYCVSMVDFL